MILRLILLSTMAPILFQAPAAWSDWQLNNEESLLSFVSVKNSAIAEGHRFRSLHGAIEDKGNASLVIALDSVDTSIAIRDERIRTLLFDLTNHPSASLNARVPVELLSEQTPGEISRFDLTGELNLNGRSATVTVPVIVSRLTGTRLQVTSATPLMVNAEQFGLLDGLEALRAVAGLKSITPMVPVYFSLVFDFGAD